MFLSNLWGMGLLGVVICLAHRKSDEFKSHILHHNNNKLKVRHYNLYERFHSLIDFFLKYGKIQIRIFFTKLFSLWQDGRVWLIALVLKTSNGEIHSGVQIPLLSPNRSLVQRENTCLTSKVS